MGMLADLGDAESPSGPVVGGGRAFVEWWRTVADDDDRATIRRWVETPVGRPGHRTYEDISAALSAIGHRMGVQTVHRGVRALRRLGEWET